MLASGRASSRASTTRVTLVPCRPEEAELAPSAGGEAPRGSERPRAKRSVSISCRNGDGATRQRIGPRRAPGKPEARARELFLPSPPKRGRGEKKRGPGQSAFLPANRSG